MKAYEDMLRDIVREYGGAKYFRPQDVRLDDERLAVALKKFDDTLPEVAGDIAEGVADILRFKQNNGFVQMLGSKSHYEAIGLSLVAGCRERLVIKVRNDAALKADDMVSEEITDSEYEEAHV